MDILSECANYLNQSVAKWTIPKGFQGSQKQAKLLAIDVMNRKSYIFNTCTIVLIASAIFGMCEIISSRKAMILGTCAYLGRRVVDKSLDVKLPCIINLIKFLLPDITKPDPHLNFGEIVLFYKILPRSY